MNKIFKHSFIALSLVLTLGFSACTEEVEYTPASVSTEGVQAYFYNNAQTSFTLLPDDEQKIQVTISRESTGEATVHLSGDNDVFAFPATINFAGDEKSKAFDITMNLEIGESAELTLQIAEEETYEYAPSEITLTVMRDYTWVSAGTASYTDNSFGLGTGNVPVEQAKEMPNLYRLKNVYQSLAGEGKAGPGSLQFTLDENCQAESITPVATFFDMGVGYWFYYDPAQFADYCFFTNDGNAFTIGALMSPDQNSLYIVSDSFVWEGWPGDDAE